MNKMRNRGQKRVIATKRIALRPLNSNEIYRRNQKRNGLNPLMNRVMNTNPIPSFSGLTDWNGDTKMSDSESDDMFTVDINDEPPTKKRKTNRKMNWNSKSNFKLKSSPKGPKLILSPVPPPQSSSEGDEDDGNRYIDVMDQGTPIRNTNTQNVKVSVTAFPQNSTENKSKMYSNGKMSDLSAAKRQAVPILDQNSMVITNLKATNKELTEQVAKYKVSAKVWYQKCKTLKHRKETLKETVKALSARDRAFKTDRDRMKIKVQDLEMKLEALNEQMLEQQRMIPDDPDEHQQPINNLQHQQQIAELQQKITDIEYEANSWKLKYNKLLQNTNEVQQTMFAQMVPVLFIVLSVIAEKLGC